MALTVTTPANSTKLCLVGDIMDEMDVSPEDEATLDRMIQQASDSIVKYCERQFAKQTYTETVPGFGDNHLLLSVAPIASVTSVVSDGLAITDFVLQEPESGLLYREAGWLWTTKQIGMVSPKPAPYGEEFSYTVVYVAGYDLPDHMLPTLPGPIERAAIITVKDWFANRSRNLSIKKLRTTDLAVEHEDNAIPPTALRLLSPFRNV